MSKQRIHLLAPERWGAYALTYKSDKERVLACEFVGHRWVDGQRHAVPVVHRSVARPALTSAKLHEVTCRACRRSNTFAQARRDANSFPRTPPWNRSNVRFGRRIRCEGYHCTTCPLHQDPELAGLSPAARRKALEIRAAAEADVSAERPPVQMNRTRAARIQTPEEP